MPAQEPNGKLADHPPNRGRDTLLMLVSFLAVLLVGDAALDRLRLPPVFGSRNASRAKWDEFQTDAENPDVVFLGSSQCLMGIDPLTVQDELRRRLGPVQCFNLCATACASYTQYLIVRKLIKQGYRPRVVYLELTPAGTIASPTSWIKNGLRAMGGLPDLWVGVGFGGDVLREALLTAAFRSHRHWPDLRLAVRHLIMGAPIHPVNPKIVERALGWATPAPGVPDMAFPKDDGASRPGDGGSGSRVSFNPNPAGLDRAIRLLRHHGITVRLLEPPVSDMAAPRVDPARNPAYLRFVDQVEHEHAIRVLRPPAGMFSRGDFFDAIHLNAAGARKLSRWLARDVAIALGPGDAPIQVARGSDFNRPGD